MREDMISKVEIEATLQDYRQQVQEVKASIDWEDYFKLIEIATETNANNAVDLAWRLGYQAGKQHCLSELKTTFPRKVV